MKHEYKHEPKKSEIILTRLLGSTVLQKYYDDFIRELALDRHDVVLDYCAGAGQISSRAARKVTDGKLVYADVSSSWQSLASKKLSKCNVARKCLFHSFDKKLLLGQYDKIIMHFVMHDIDAKYRMAAINHMIMNLKKDGMIYIREPVDDVHGLKLYELINMIEATKVLSYDYVVRESFLIGKYADLKCRLRKEA